MFVMKDPPPPPPHHPHHDYPPALLTKGLLRKFCLSTVAWMVVLLLFPLMNVLVLIGPL